MSQASMTPREQRYAQKLNLDARLAAASPSPSPSKRRPTPRTPAQNLHQPPTANVTAAPAPQTQPRPVAVTNAPTANGGSAPSSSESSEPSDSSSEIGSDSSELPWSPAYPGPVPSTNLLEGIQPQPNTDFTVQLPWLLRLLFQWNFLRLYGTTMVAVNDGLEPDYFTGRIYGYVNRQDPNTALTVNRLQAFFRLSTLFHLYRLAIISTISYRIPLTLFRYGLMKYGFFPLFEFDIMIRWFLNGLVLFLGLWCLDFWPLNLKAHIRRLMAAFLVQIAVWSYFQEQKELRDLIYQLPLVVWISVDVFWTVLHQYTTLPITSASTMWYVAGLDINPFFLVTKLYPLISRAYTRWSFCENFGKEVQGLCFLTPEADFPDLLQELADPLSTTTVTKQPTITSFQKVFYSVPKPTIITETDTKTILQGPITGAENITRRTSSMAYVQAFITTMVQTVTKALTGKSSEVPLPDSTCPWTCSGICTTPSPEAYGE
jgi:hypothetical protein